MTVQKTFLLLSLMVLMLNSGCDSPLDPGPQPTEIEPTPFVPGHNILGVLRRDGERGSSFIFCTRAFRYEDWNGDEDFDPTIKNARVTIMNRDSTRRIPFEYTRYGSNMFRYMSSRFKPAENEEYFLRVTSPNLPELRASTIVPTTPRIDFESFSRTEETLSFTLLGTSDTYMYDIKLFCSEIEYFQRLFNDGDGLIEVSFDFDSSDELLYFEIYGYDENLARYLNSAITLKPQTYQQPTSTVTGGYGCFGSVAKRVVWFARR